MGTDRLNGSLYTKVENGIATIEFGHPAGNSFVLELLQRLEKEFDKLGADNKVLAIVLCSEGEAAFCGGASFKELAAISNQEQGTAFFSGFASVINAMRNCPQPVIGRVQGKAVGGGVGLAASCDYVFATEAAAIKLSELSIGIGPLVIAPAVERKIGKAGLAELALSPTEWKNAYWAQQKGLFARVFKTITEMDKELEIFSSKIASYSPQALREIKKILWEGTSHWDELLIERARRSGKLALSTQSKAAIEKFNKK